MIVIFVLIAVLVNVALFVSTYRRLVSLKEETHTAWGKIDSLLKQRHELVPNLLTATRQAMHLETEILEAVRAAQESALSVTESATPERAALVADAEGRLSAALKRLVAELDRRHSRASAAICILQHEISLTESEVAEAGRAYNAAAAEYNVMQQQFPTVLLTGLAETGPAELWQIQENDPCACKSENASETVATTDSQSKSQH